MSKIKKRAKVLLATGTLMVALSGCGVPDLRDPLLNPSGKPGKGGDGGVFDWLKRDTPTPEPGQRERKIGEGIKGFFGGLTDKEPTPTWEGEKTGFLGLGPTTTPPATPMPTATPTPKPGSIDPRKILDVLESEFNTVRTKVPEIKETIKVVIETGEAPKPTYNPTIGGRTTPRYLQPQTQPTPTIRGYNGPTVVPRYRKQSYLFKEDPTRKGRDYERTVQQRVKRSYI